MIRSIYLNVADRFSIFDGHSDDFMINDLM